MVNFDENDVQKNGTNCFDTIPTVVARVRCVLRFVSIKQHRVLANIRNCSREFRGVDAAL